MDGIAGGPRPAAEPRPPEICVGLLDLGFAVHHKGPRGDHGFADGLSLEEEEERLGVPVSDPRLSVGNEADRIPDGNRAAFDIDGQTLIIKEGAVQPQGSGGERPDGSGLHPDHPDGHAEDFWFGVG